MLRACRNDDEFPGRQLGSLVFYLKLTIPLNYVHYLIAAMLVLRAGIAARLDGHNCHLRFICCLENFKKLSFEIIYFNHGIQCKSIPPWCRIYLARRLHHQARSHAARAHRLRARKPYNFFQIPCEFYLLRSYRFSI